MMIMLQPLVNHPLLVNDSPVRTPSLTHPLQFSYIIVRVSEGVAHGNTSSGGPQSGGGTSGLGDPAFASTRANTTRRANNLADCSQADPTFGYSIIIR